MVLSIEAVQKKRDSTLNYEIFSQDEKPNDQQLSSVVPETSWRFAEERPVEYV